MHDFYMENLQQVYIKKLLEKSPVGIFNNYAGNTSENIRS